MKDALGGKLEPGALLVWHIDPQSLRRGLLCTVVQVDEPQLVDGNGDVANAPKLIVQIVIHVQPNPRGGDIVLEDFLRLVNPQAQSALERLMTEGRLPVPSKTQ